MKFRSLGLELSDITVGEIKIIGVESLNSV